MAFKFRKREMEPVDIYSEQETNRISTTAISRQPNISRDAVTDELYNFFSQFNREDIRELEVSVRARAVKQDAESFEYGYMRVDDEMITHLRTTSIGGKQDYLEHIFDELVKEIRIPMEDFDQSQQQLHQEELNQLQHTD